jgi:hypothetical protein
MSIIFIYELIFNQKSASRYGYTFVFLVNTHTIATVGQTKRCGSSQPPPPPNKKPKQKQNKTNNTHTQTKNTLKTNSTGVNAK